MNRDWLLTEGSSENQYVLIPPPSIGLPDDYRLTISTSSNKVDFAKYYKNLLQIISDFYVMTSEDLDLILNEEDTILRVRIYDNDTSNGTIGFLRFEGVIEKLKAILTDVASFVIDRNVTSTRVPAEAHKYLNKCNFLQTEKGSYVTKIQLPSKELIKDNELFDRREIYAEEINRKLNEVLGYVNSMVFTNQVTEVDDEYLIENESKLNIKLLKDIEILYDKSDIKNIDFGFHNLEHSSIIESQNITKEKISKLTQFIENVSNNTVETKEVKIKGVITTLKSKDPDGLKNSITMTGVYEDLPVVATANLSSEDYKSAIEAHKIKEYITVGGLGRISKTRIRFLRIDTFQMG